MSEFPGNSLKAFIPSTDSWLSIQDIFSISSFQVIQPAEFQGNSADAITPGRGDSIAMVWGGGDMGYRGGWGIGGGGDMGIWV